MRVSHFLLKLHADQETQLCFLVDAYVLLLTVHFIIIILLLLLSLLLLTIITIIIIIRATHTHSVN